MNPARRTASRDTVVASVEALGVPIQIIDDGSSSGEAVSAIRSAWRDCSTGDGHGDDWRHVRISADATLDTARALSDLSTQVTLAALDAVRGTRLLLHAAGVAAPDGRVLAMVGPSGRGKTTASRHTATRLAYVSDESVAVDSDLTVWPYRKPLSVIIEGHQFKRQIAPSDLGLLPLPAAPLRLAGITLLDRDEDADTCGAHAVDLVDAICEMTPQISYLPELESPLQYVAHIVDRIGAVTRLIYRDATELPHLIAEMFAAPPPVPQAWSAMPETSLDGPWRTTPVDDAILVEGRACILRNGTVTALDERGCLVWTMCHKGSTTKAITEAAVEAFGEPVGVAASTLIEQTIEDLRTHGLLTSR